MAKRTQNARNQQPRLYLMMLMKKPVMPVIAQVVGLIQPATTLVMAIQIAILVHVFQVWICIIQAVQAN
jgi:hypothetical protein